MKITLEEAAKKLYELKGDFNKIFSVVFIKRTTGEERHMLCRMDAKHYLKGGEQAYDPKSKNLIFVFDMQKLAYRSINLDTIIKMKIDGIEYEVSQ